MKQTISLIFALTMLLSLCVGCSSRDVVEAYIADETMQNTEEQPADDTAAEEEETHKEEQIEPEEQDMEISEEAPEKVQEAEVDPSLYLQLFAEGISLNESGASVGAYQLNACAVLANDPVDFGTEWNTPHWITRFLVHDLNDDGIPELILQTGEVEQYIYIFTIRENAVYCTGFGYLDNQNNTEYLTLYRNHENGEVMAVSEGGTGSGAGNLYFTQYVRVTDLYCQNAAFSARDDVDLETWEYTTRYYVNDVEVSEAEYRDARDAFFAPLSAVKTLYFQDMGSDPVAALEDALNIL